MGEGDKLVPLKGHTEEINSYWVKKDLGQLYKE